MDLAAAARVAKRVELKEVRLSEIIAKNLLSYHGPLHPEVQHSCVPASHDANGIEVQCTYDFLVTSEGDDVATAQFKYMLSYEVVGDSPVDEADLEHFAFANGTYHSWPFARQLVYDLTARMGYPPYTLPVFQFNPKPKPSVVEPEATEAEAEVAPSET